MLTTTAGRPPSSARRNTCRSWVFGGFSNSIRCDSAIQRAPRQAERFRRLTHIAAIAIERLANQQTLDVLERQVFQLGRCSRRSAQGQICRAHRVTVRKENRAFYRMSQLTNVTRPRMLEELLHC